MIADDKETTIAILIKSWTEVDHLSPFYMSNITLPSYTLSPLSFLHRIARFPMTFSVSTKITQLLTLLSVMILQEKNWRKGEKNER